MTINEKVAYIKGMLEGMELESKEGKLINSMLEVLEEIGLAIEDIDASFDAVDEELNAINDELDEIEEILDDEDEYDDYVKQMIKYFLKPAIKDADFEPGSEPATNP